MNSKQARERQEELKQWFIEGGWPETPGIYGIQVNNQIVYVGQSKNLARRLAEHLFKIECKGRKEKKYELLDGISSKDGFNQPIRFCELARATEEELNDKEKYFIDKYDPCLNTVRPGRPRKDLSNYSLKDFAKDLGIDTSKYFIF